MDSNLFVTGTGTDVGKTVASTILSLGLKRAYWKPVQTGDVLDRDFASKFGATTYPSIYNLRAPRSPHEAAALEGVTLDLDRIQAPSGKLVIEGAGGVLVPLNDRALMVDLIVKLKARPIVVATSSLGTINHTLLTIEALRARGLEPMGVLLNGEADEANANAIEKYGHTRILGRIPRAQILTREWMEKVFQDWNWPEELC